MKVGKKLIIAMVLISIVPSLAVAFTVNMQMKNTVHDLQEKSLASLANVVSAHIYDFCNGQEMDSRFFGQVTAYRECLQAHEQGAGPGETEYWDAEVESLFERTTTINDNIDGGALIDATGKTILAYNKNEEGHSVANTEMYKSIMGGTELYRNTVINADGSRNINIVVPVKDESGAVIGLLKRVVNLSNLNLYIDEVEIGETGYVYVIDENATLIYHGSQEKMDLAVGEFQDREELDELLRQVSAGTLEKPSGIIRYNNRGVDTVAAYNQMEELDWVVLVAMDNEEILGPAVKATRTLGIVSILIAVATVAACYFIVQSLLFPLTQLRQRLKRIAEGDCSARCEYAQGDELASIMESVNDVAIRLDKQEQELERAKTRDVLTGMYNRMGVLELMGKRLHSEEDQAILLFDFDDFGLLNEILGQETCNEILKELSEKFCALPESVRCAGRYSGDSFVLMAESWNEEERPEALAEWVRKAVEEIRFVSGKPVHATVSGGVAYIDDSDGDLNTYLKRAATAMHKAKKSGKNTFMVFSDEL